MKTRILQCIAVCWLCGALPARAQSTFTNLDFELAHVPPGTEGWLPASDALPGWICYLGTNEQFMVTYNGLSIGMADIALIGSGTALPPIQGEYSVLVVAGVGPETGLSLVPAAIAQTGFIPANAKSLRFAALNGVNELVVTVGGQNIPFSLHSESSGTFTYAGDISAFAGETTDLRFTEVNDGFSGVHALLLDSIRFSALPVPVPVGISATSTNTVLLSWPSRTDTFAVQASSVLKSTNWVTLTNEPVAAGFGSQLTLPMQATPTFYRLISR